MAQHDYNLINQSGADFRADLNNALSAIVSNNSGSTEPGTKFAYEWWVDEATGKMKLRNSANNAWITMPFNISADNSVDINVGTINGVTAFSLASGATVNSILDEDNFNSNSATALATQQSIKAYVDNQVTAQDLDITDGSSVIGIDLDSQVLSLLGGTGVSATASGKAVTFNIGQAVAASDNVVFNQVTAAVIGNASTATTLQNARTISGISFNGSANITLNTSTITENTNLYYTNERVDDRVAAFIQNGTGITWVYADGSNTLTPTVSLTPFNTGQLSEGSNLYYTDARFDTRLASKDTDNLSEGSNLYYTNARARAAISENSTQLSYNSGTGVLTYTQGNTGTVAEGSNLYYTDARSNTAIDSKVNKAFIDNLNVVAATTSGLAGSASILASARTIALTGDVVGSLSFNGSTDVSMATAIQANSVTLGTDTVGSYIKTIAGTANKITVTGSGSETAAVTLTLPNDVQIANNLTVAGNLAINGDLTYLDTTNLKIEDNLFELNANLTGSPVNDSGMLINRGSANNSIFYWDESVDKFTLGLTTADGSSTGNITLASLGALVANLEGNVTGNVSGSAATVTGAAQTAITSVGTLTGLTTTGNINLGDNDKAVFGANAELEIYHDGTSSIIKETDGSGNLKIMGSNIEILNAAGQDMIAANSGSFVRLYYSNSLKLATTSTGIDVTGAVTATSLDISGDIDVDGVTNLDVVDIDGAVNMATTLAVAGATTMAGGSCSANFTLADNARLQLGSETDLQIYHDASDSYIADNGTGDLYISGSNNIVFRKAGSSAVKAKMITDGAVELYYDNAKKLETNGGGVTVTGTAILGGASFVDNATAFFGTGLDLRIFHDGFNSYINDVGTGSLYIKATNLSLSDAAGGQFLNAYSGSGVVLYHNNNQKLETTSAGVTVTGALTTSSGATFGSHTRVNGDFSVSAASGEDRFAILPQAAGSGTIFFSGNEGLTGYEPLIIDFETLALRTSGTPRLSIASNGAATFAGTIASGSITSSGIVKTATTFQSSSGSMLFFVPNVGEAMRIEQNTGRVGIGTNSPASPLHVNGNAQFGVGNSKEAFIQATNSGRVASNPAYSFNGDVDTGMFNPNIDNTIAFATGGSERMRLDSSGNLGIGCSPSSYPIAPNLVVDAGTNGGVTIKSGTSNYGGVFFADGTTGNEQYRGFVQYNHNYAGSTDELLLGTAGAEKMRLDSSGKVNIGGTNMSQLLNIQTASSSVAPQIEFRNTQAGTQIGMPANTNALFFTTADNERMRLDSAGRLGLGTSSPQQRLHVVGGQARFDDHISIQPTKKLFLDGGNDTYIDEVAANTIAFNSGGAERMRLDASGNLMVGGSDSGNAGTINLAVGVVGSTTGGLQLWSGTGGNHYVQFGDTNSSNGPYRGAIGYKHSGDAMVLYTAGAEKMRLDASGTLLLGGTSSTANAEKLAVLGGSGTGALFSVEATHTTAFGAVKFRNGNGEIGSISLFSTSVGYNTSSDARLKDVTGKARGLEVINALNPVAYNWKADGKADEGLIAQEVLDIIPNAVSGSEEDMYQMDYSKLVVHLVAGMKEQQTQIEELKTEINNLKGE